jgi:DNA-binding NtrC family response regulator
VEEAHGGTLFLDEIGDLSLSMQTKLLRLLQEGEYKPVGSTRTRQADIRFVAATNHRLEEEVQSGNFREDLYYRLNVIHIHMPCLARRREDIPVLAHHFMRKYALLYQKQIRQISTNALQSLGAYPFSGNVRELENLIERGVIFCRSDTLEIKDIFSAPVENRKNDTATDPDIFSMPFREAKEAAITEFYRRYIRGLLSDSDGNISRAAEKAGIQRQYLHRLIKEAGLEAESFKRKNGG